MNQDTINRIKKRFGVGGNLKNHEVNFVYIKPTFTVAECEQIFFEMTNEIFEHHRNKLKNQSLMVHLTFPYNKKGLYPTKQVNSSEAVEPNPEVTGVKINVPNKILLQSGTLEECHITYPEFKSSYDFYYFKHNQFEKYEKIIKTKLIADGIVPEHEWYFVYLSPGAKMGKHVDHIPPYMRYSFAVRQPITRSSIIIDGNDYYMPEGSAYILDGTIPHEVIQNANTPRIMLLGAIEI